MNKFYLVSFLLVFGEVISMATEYTISISGLSFSPTSLQAKVGDVIIISASSTHPVMQVSESTWNANSSTELSEGWGTKTSEFQITLSDVGTIYYVCSNHVGSGMKAKIEVSDATGINKNVTNKGLLYPNPVMGYVFYVDLGVETKSLQGFTLQMYDILGKPRFSIYQKSMEIKRPDLPNGLYFYKLFDGQQNILGVGKIYFK